ncbi:MAG: exonuclease domain-containing protein [Acidobacteriota bacterium]|nr:exonuclease domain-containing protein [Acidobacteriota bacterium]
MSHPEVCVAVDFETASSKRSSVCAMGIAIIEGQKIAARASWLIHPPELYFDPYNTYIHGITEEDVADKPEFNKLWDGFRQYFEGRLVVAHNASFDMSVLRHVLDEYGIPYPQLSYLCTRVTARRVWPGLHGYGLTTVCDYLGVEFKHHDAEEDAVACAEVALRASHQISATTIAELMENTGILSGQLHPGGYKSCHVRQTHEGLAAIRAAAGDFNQHHPFFEKTVVFTGTLQSMVRKEAAQRVVNSGGHCGESLARETNFLVLGDLDFSKLKGGVKSSKLKKAESLLASGSDIEIISEAEFLRMLAE